MRPGNLPLPILLLSRLEGAGINASAPPQQRWVDGWWLRFSPGKAQRARCVQAVANGQRPTAAGLAFGAARNRAGRGGFADGGLHAVQSS